MTNIEKKQSVVTEIKARVDKAASLLLVDARGLTVAQDTELRKKLREAGVDYKVYKNTLISRAIEGTAFAGLDKYLEGPTAAAFSYDDATAAARLISKELKAMPKLEFKAAVVEGAVYDAAGVTAIANIPPRAELLSKLLGSFKSPLSSFARLVNAYAEEKAKAE